MMDQQPDTAPLQTPDLTLDPVLSTWKSDSRQYLACTRINAVVVTMGAAWSCLFAFPAILGACFNLPHWFPTVWQWFPQETVQERVASYAFAAGPVAIAMFVSLWLRCIASKCISFVHRGAEHDDVRIFGPAVEILASMNLLTELCSSDHLRGYGDREVCEATLCRILPHMRASNANILDDKHRIAINKILVTAKPETIIIVLNALQQVGDKTNVAAVQALADGRRPEENIRQAALECLPVLLARSENERLSNMLLRSSDGLVSGPSELLRATIQDQVTEDQNLLRAHNSPE